MKPFRQPLNFFFFLSIPKFISNILTVLDFVVKIAVFQTALTVLVFLGHTIIFAFRFRFSFNDRWKSFQSFSVFTKLQRSSFLNFVP